jgi:hypothetical protein
MADDSLVQVARIAAGEFVMGADDGEEDERPVHLGVERVTPRK